MRITRFYVPRYSLTAHIIGVVVVCIIAAACVAAGLHRAPLQESSIATTVLCAVMLAYFTVILYRGFRFDHGRITWKVPKIDPVDVGDALSNVQGPDLGSVLHGFDAAEGCLGLIVGIVVGVVAFVAITVLLSYGIEAGMTIVVLVAVPLYGIFRLSARMVIVHTRRCRGRLWMSLAIALPYAVLYTALMGTVFYGIERMLSHAARAS
jgi:hypothetical protein